MTRTIHGFESEIFIVDFQCEHVVFIILPMSRRFPEIGIVHVWGADFLETSGVVFRTNKVLERVVDPHSMGEPESTSGRYFMEEEEILFFSDLAMITFGGFGKEFFVFRHLFFVGETDSIYSL